MDKKNPLHYPTKKALDVPQLLLVEDSPIALRMVELAVAEAGCAYISAEDGLIALELAKAHDFDLIVTDIGLPGISGIELTAAIRSWEQSENKSPTPIVALTAHTDEAEAIKCLQAGMNKVLKKPVTFKLIQHLISEFISENRK